MSEEKFVPYSWGKFYETVKECGGDCENENVKKGFALFEKLDKANSLYEVINILNKNPLNTQTINMINSPCLDGILLSIYQYKPLQFLIKQHPEYIDTCAYYLSKKMVKRSLFLACKNGREKIVELLLNYGAKASGIKRYAKRKYHAINYAVENGSVKLIEILLKYDSYVPLCKIIRENKYELFEFLLEKIEPDLKDLVEALSQAIENKRTNFVNILMQKYKIPIVFRIAHVASLNGYTDIVKLFLETNPSIYEIQKCFVAAVYLKSFVIVKLLLPYANVQDFICTACKDIDMVKFLLQHGAVLIIDCLHSALGIDGKKKRLEMFNFILDNSVNMNLNEVNREVNEGRTILTAASIYGYDDVINLLLDRGAKICDDAINCAFSNENYSTVRLLLSRGANPSAIKLRYRSEKCKCKKEFTDLLALINFMKQKSIE